MSFKATMKSGNQFKEIELRMSLKTVTEENNNPLKAEKQECYEQGSLLNPIKVPLEEDNQLKHAHREESEVITDATPSGDATAAAVTQPTGSNAEATDTARKLAAGEAKLVNVGGREVLAPPGKMPIPKLTPTKPGLGQPTPTAGLTWQAVQIVKGADGKIQKVHGLLPGQKLLQMPDGKMKIFSNKQVLAGADTVIQNTQPQIKMASPQAVTQQQVVQQPQVIQQQPQMIQQQLQLLAKTYTIKRNPNVRYKPNLKPIQPKPQPKVTPQTPNTVSIMDNQLVVQGTNDAITRNLTACKSKLGSGRMDADMMIEEATRENESSEHEDCEGCLNVRKDLKPEHTKRGDSAVQPDQTADSPQDDQSGLVENPRKRRKPVQGSQSPSQSCSRSKRPYKITADAEDITVVGEVKKEEGESFPTMYELPAGTRITRVVSNEKKTLEKGVIYF